MSHLFRKFYNIDSPEATSTPSAASLLAQYGQMVQSDKAVELQPINIGGQEPTKETEQQTEPAVSATSDSSTVTTETQETSTPEAPAQEAAATQAPLEQPQPQVQVSWQEVLRQQQPNTVLQELGYDEQLVKTIDAIKAEPKMLAFFQHWMNNGDTTAFLREANIDYTKMPAEEVMRHQLRAEYPNMSDRHLQVLFEDEVLERYKLDPEKYSEEEVERGRLLLEAKAERYRNQLVENQKNFLLPKPPEPKPAEATADNSAEVARQQEFENYKSTISADAYTKSLLTDKKLYIGEGDERFGFPVEPNELTEILFDTDKWASSFFNTEVMPDGTKRYVPDVEKQLLVAGVIKHGKRFFSEYANHLKSLGAKAAIEPIVNASIPDGSKPASSEAAPKTAAEAMAKHGRLV